MNEQNSKLEQFTAKLTKETKTKLAELYESGDFSTWNQLIELLYERYMAPRNADKENLKRIAELQAHADQLQAHNAELQAHNAELQAHNAELQTHNAELQTHNAELQANNTELQAHADQLQTQFNEFKKTQKLPENNYIIGIDKLNYLVLEHVASVEGKRRKQEWSVEDVINYFIEHLLVKGEVNGDLKSPANEIILKLKKQIETE